MKIATGSTHMGNEQIHDFDSVRFLAADGRTMFEVSANKDGRSIEVRGVEVCKVGDQLFSEQLVIRPRVGNCITVSTMLWGEK